MGWGFDLYLVLKAQSCTATFVMQERLVLDTRARAREDRGREELQERDEGSQERATAGGRGALSSPPL